MIWICKQCGIKLKNQNPTTKNTVSFDWNYFCSRDCVNKYEEELYNNEESTSKVEIKSEEKK